MNWYHLQQFRSFITLVNREERLVFNCTSPSAQSAVNEIGCNSGLPIYTYRGFDKGKLQKKDTADSRLM
ncbi:hypothetical protein [Dapis sp. BLCC M229]|uniref:hypothetical protein n=1 Tax=Dapis sp. BLCC M229 TaxID=3400188 RepID=UPI003CEB4F1F